MLSRRRLWVFGIALLLAGWGTYGFRVSTPGPYDRQGVFKGADYRHFYVLGRLALQRRGDALYTESAHVALARAEFEPRRSDSFGRPAYGPQTALLFAPLATLPYFPSLLVFSLLSATTYLVAAWWSVRHLSRLRQHVGLVTVLLLASPAFVVLINFGQSSAIGLAGLTVAIEGWRRGAPALVGLGVGVLCYKPTLALVPLALLLLTRQGRALGIAVSVVLGQLFLSAMWFGSDSLGHYAASLLSIAVAPALNEPHPELLHSFSGFFNLLLGRGLLSTTLALASGAAVLAGFIRYWHARGPTVHSIAALGLAMMLVSPHLTTYDLVLLVPGLLPLAALPWAPEDRAPLLIAGIYLAPVLAAALGPGIRVQVSTILLALLLWRLLTSKCSQESIFTDTDEFQSVSE